MQRRSKIAYFVSPHGFGHAARAAAVIEAAHRLAPDLDFEIVTTAAPWIFEQSLGGRYRLRPVVCDVGMIQLDPFREDPQATVAALDRFWKGLEADVEGLLRGWASDPPRLVVSDISPLGLEVARRLSAPSILVENFTWDWIYAAYRERAPTLAGFGERFRELAETATLHVQCEPACRIRNDAIQVPPVSREPRSTRTETRRALGLDDADHRPLILLTFGGLGWTGETPPLDGRCVLVTLGGTDRLSRSDSLIRLPDRPPVYPPDIVWAADAVIAKLGYSTVAECFRAGGRLGYLTRPEFPESPVLEAFVRERLPSLEFPSRADRSSWSRSLERLLALGVAPGTTANGADGIAELIARRLG